MKRQPTEVVALCVHGLTVIFSSLVWFRAFKEWPQLKDFGIALPAATSYLYDLHLPAVLCVLLVSAFAASMMIRGTGTLIVSLISVGVGVPSLGALYYALRLPFMDTY